MTEVTNEKLELFDVTYMGGVDAGKNMISAFGISDERSDAIGDLTSQVLKTCIEDEDVDDYSKVAFRLAKLAKTDAELFVIGMVAGSQKQQFEMMKAMQMMRKR